MATNDTEVTEKAKVIREVKLKADHQSHWLSEALNVAFIAPIDRKDVADLGQGVIMKNN